MAPTPYRVSLFQKGVMAQDSW